MIKQPNHCLVVIDPVLAEEKSEGGIIMPELVKENQQKKQNRGTVVLTGKDCTFVVPGDFVSFYRNAATPVIEDEKEFLIINEAHILCQITHEKK